MNQFFLLVILFATLLLSGCASTYIISIPCTTCSSNLEEIAECTPICKEIFDDAESELLKVGKDVKTGYLVSDGSQYTEVSCSCTGKQEDSDKLLTSIQKILPEILSPEDLEKVVVTNKIGA